MAEWVARLMRNGFFTDRTLGTLTLPSGVVLQTLEDKRRPVGVKVPGATCILPGRYRLTINWSNRFQRRMPQLLGVPDFTGIRVHAGNGPKDTDGCILVGMQRHYRTLDDVGPTVIRSREAYTIFLSALQLALSNLTDPQDCFIEIQEVP